MTLNLYIFRCIIKKIQLFLLSFPPLPLFQVLLHYVLELLEEFILYLYIFIIMSKTNHIKSSQDENNNDIT